MVTVAALVLVPLALLRDLPCLPEHRPALVLTGVAPRRRVGHRRLRARRRGGRARDRRPFGPAQHHLARNRLRRGRPRHARPWTHDPWRVRSPLQPVGRPPAVSGDVRLRDLPVRRRTVTVVGPEPVHLAPSDAVDRRSDAHDRGPGHDRVRPTDGTQWRNGVHVGGERVRRRLRSSRGTAGLRGAHALAALASRTRRVPVRDRAGGDRRDRGDHRLRARQVPARLLVGLSRLSDGRLRRCRLRGLPSARRRATLTEVLNSAFVDDPFEHIVSGYPRRCGRSFGQSRSRTPTPTGTASARRGWRSSSGCRWDWRPTSCV